MSSRREFMKGAACLVGAAAIGPVAGAVERISVPDRRPRKTPNGDSMVGFVAPKLDKIRS